VEQVSKSATERNLKSDNFGKQIKVVNNKRNNSMALQPKPLSDLKSITAKVEGNELVIRCKLGTPIASGSGKSMLVASTAGNRITDIEVKGKKVILGLNAFYPV
jgi:hypothetical protein